MTTERLFSVRTVRCSATCRGRISNEHPSSTTPHRHCFSSQNDDRMTQEHSWRDSLFVISWARLYPLSTLQPVRGALTFPYLRHHRTIVDFSSQNDARLAQEHRWRNSTQLHQLKSLML